MFRTLRKLLRPGFRVPGRTIAKTPRVVILASGTAQRWESNQHKQLVEVAGKPLILRTLEQISRRWDTLPIVVTHHEAIARVVSPIADALELAPGDRRWTVETALSSRAAWGDPTLILAGDVYWTDAAMDIACGLNRGGPVRYLVTQCGVTEDVLGVWFRRRHRHKLAKALNHARQHALTSGGSGKLWQSYRSLCGFPLTRHWLEDIHTVRIDDETTDFDSQRDYQAFLASRVRSAA